jgi:hypothetical protein
MSIGKKPEFETRRRERLAVTDSDWHSTETKARTEACQATQTPGNSDTEVFKHHQLDVVSSRLTPFHSGFPSVVLHGLRPTKLDSVWL